MFKTPNQDQIGIHFPCEILKNEVSLNLSFAKLHSDNKVKGNAFINCRL